MQYHLFLQVGMKNLFILTVPHKSQWLKKYVKAPGTLTGVFILMQIPSNIIFDTKEKCDYKGWQPKDKWNGKTHK